MPNPMLVMFEESEIVALVQRMEFIPSIGSPKAGGTDP